MNKVKVLIFSQYSHEETIEKTLNESLSKIGDKLISLKCTATDTGIIYTILYKD